MYFSINTTTLKGLENGMYFLYTSSAGSRIIVVDIQKRYNARSPETKSSPKLSDYAIIQCIDPSEISVIDPMANPEYFV